MYALIRSWESMEEEYGIDDDGDIKIPGSFTTDMKKFAGKVINIINDKFDETGEYIYYGGARWEISPEMIERFLNKEDDPEYFL